MDPLKILFLEDNPNDVELIQFELKKAKFSFHSLIAGNKNEFVEALYKNKPDIVLSDHSLPQFDSLAALQIVKDSSLNLPFILVTGTVSEEFAVACIKNGADDYILKNNIKRLPSAIISALNKKNLKTENIIIKKINDELKKAYIIIEQKNKMITDSLNYAKFIQTKILPDGSKLNEIFSHSFIFFKPKDIVSGDFYWFAADINRFICAMVDCTGHGVPGALLSITAYHLLEEVFWAMNITRPAEILHELNRKIWSVFNPDKKDSIKDGMEIAICSFHLENKTLEFAGAKRPLFLIRNKELQIIKGSRAPIGGLESLIPNYENVNINLQPFDRIYLFSDGFYDQFNNNYDERLGMKHFKSFLLSTVNTDMKAQKKIFENYFDSWKGENEQIDDVLVIGIEI